MPISPDRKELFDELCDVYWNGQQHGPSAYLSAMYESATLDELKAEIAKWKEKHNANKS